MKSMERLVALALALCLLLSLTACNDEKEPVNPSPDQTTSDPVVSTTTADTTETATDPTSTTTASTDTGDTTSSTGSTTTTPTLHSQTTTQKTSESTTVTTTVTTKTTTKATTKITTTTTKKTTTKKTTKKPSTTTKVTTTTTTKPRPTLAQPSGKDVVYSRRYRSADRIGDWGGPAYAVYSKRGYNRASIDVELSDVEINMIRKSDGKHLVGYIFLGMNIYDAEKGHWVNCLDAGLQYDAVEKQWRLFHFINNVSVPNQSPWYTSRRGLDPTHDYRLILDCSKSNGWTTLSAYDLTEGKVADSVEFQSRWSLKDGSNVDFLQDYAIDMPEDTMYDLSGNKHEDIYMQVSDQVWKEIILYNSNENVYMRNVKITNAMLNNQLWTADKTRLRGCSPDTKQADIGYDVIKVTQANFDSEFRLDIDLKY